MKVTDPTGQTWRVSRRWVPWRRKWRDVDAAGFDVPGGLGDDPLSVLVVMVVVLISLPLVVVGVVAVLELLLLVVLLPLAVLGRVLLGQHWHVELRQGWRPHWETEAGDWSQSGTVIHDVAARVQRGDIPEPTLARPAA